MSEPNVLVNFRLDRERPLRVKWIATDGVPGDGYKAQITAIRTTDGSEIHMDATAILEQSAADPAGGKGAYLVTFNGVVGFPADHPDREIIDRLGDDEDVEYDVTFMTEDGRAALEEEDYTVVERPLAKAHKLSHRTS